MNKDQELDLIKFHWGVYVNAGGISSPLSEHDIKALSRRGVEHWTSFLALAKRYIKNYPKDREVLESFLPKKLVKLLVGE